MDRWEEAGACRHEDPELFFPISINSPETDKALRICRRCPVQDQCLTAALTRRENYGIWGGTTEEQRRRIIRLQRGLARDPDRLEAERYVSSYPPITPANAARNRTDLVTALTT
jgi:WhiB family redox-sensing transcriptional regulator